MTSLDIHLPVAEQESLTDYVDYATLAETNGYDVVWLPESWGRDATTVLAAIATETETVGIGSSIMNVYSRSPALLGQTAATLQEHSDGRFRLGIGPSGPIVIQGWHGEQFERPLRRVRETVEVVNAVTNGDTVNYDGDIFNLAGFRLRCDPPEPRPPVAVAGIGPKMVELAGRFADGWHATVMNPDGMRARLDDLERGADLGDRDVDDVRVTFAVTSCVLEDGEEARALARGHLAFYVGGMGDYYRQALTRQGYEDEANAIAIAWGNRDKEAAMAEISDEMLDEYAIAGTPEHAHERLETFRAIDGVDAVATGFPRGASRAQIEATIEALAP